MTPDTLTFQLINQCALAAGATVYATITGFAYSHGNDLFLLRADGSTPYYPSSPADDLTEITEDCAIPLGALGSSTTITVPKLFSARIYFSVGEALHFCLNKGPALVQPSVSNPNDRNINIQWGFCEFTYSDAELFCNISYVDFIGLPIALDLTTKSGSEQHVKGIAANGIDSICSALQRQTASDNQPWSSLIYAHDGKNLRVLSPNQGIVMTPSLFSGYYEPYIESFWKGIQSIDNLQIDTQHGEWKIISGALDSTSKIAFTISNEPDNTWCFTPPTTANIFNCSNGPFEHTNDAKGNISARLAAAFNRTTLLNHENRPLAQPNEAEQEKYYTGNPTNHYSRIVHAANLDRRGYAFPYDDVQPSGAPDLSGKVEATDPDVLTVTVGGAQWGDQTAEL